MMNYSNFNVAVLPLPSADILDFMGPLDILSHTSRSTTENSEKDPAFAIYVLGNDTIIKTHDNFRIVPDFEICKALSLIEYFDVLFIVGGPLSEGGDLSEHIKLVKRFVEQDGRAEEIKPRVIFAASTGVHLLGAAGVLKGVKKVTTFEQGQEALKKLCGPVTEVVKVGDEFIDGGFTEKGIRVITAGARKSGLRATAHLIDLLLRNEATLRANKEWGKKYW